MEIADTNKVLGKAQLLKASVTALAGAAIILVAAVLPAEYGIDPTGLGKMMGLTAMNGAAARALPAVDATPLVAAGAVAPTAELPPNAAGGDHVAPGAVAKSAMPLKTDAMSLTLAPDTGAEIKARMKKGQQFVFEWKTNGAPVEVDMHGEPPNAGTEVFTSYWKVPQQGSAQGAFVAPFDGTHGWYWRNNSRAPVTVSVKVSGFYDTPFKP